MRHARRSAPAQFYATCGLYGIGLLILAAALAVRVRPALPPISALARALHRGEVAPQVPRLDADDAAARRQCGCGEGGARQQTAATAGSEEQIERAMDDILNEDVDGFISKYIALSARHQGE